MNPGYSNPPPRAEGVLDASPYPGHFPLPSAQSLRLTGYGQGGARTGLPEASPQYRTWNFSIIKSFFLFSRRPNRTLRTKNSKHSVKNRSIFLVRNRRYFKFIWREVIPYVARNSKMVASHLNKQSKQGTTGAHQSLRRCLQKWLGTQFVLQSPTH